MFVTHVTELCRGREKNTNNSTDKDRSYDHRAFGGKRLNHEIIPAHSPLTAVYHVSLDTAILRIIITNRLSVLFMFRLFLVYFCWLPKTYGKITLRIPCLHNSIEKVKHHRLLLNMSVFYFALQYFFLFCVYRHREGYTTLIIFLISFF